MYCVDSQRTQLLCQRLKSSIPVSFMFQKEQKLRYKVSNWEDALTTLNNLILESDRGIEVHIVRDKNGEYEISLNFDFKRNVCFKIVGLHDLAW